jgi:spectinomycin phosphotransferase
MLYPWFEGKTGYVCPLSEPQWTELGNDVGGAWTDPRETKWFFSGYGPADIDLTAIAFYRYERIVVDIAEYGQRIFDSEGRTEDRQRGLQKLASGFKPNNVVDMAHRSYLALG